MEMTDENTTDVVEVTEPVGNAEIDIDGVTDEFTVTPMLAEPVQPDELVTTTE